MSISREDVVDIPFEAPENDLEEAVTGIVTDVLGLDRVGRTDSFYDMGGTSLQAIRICARIESGLGLDARPQWLLESDIMHVFASQLGTASEKANG